MIIIPAIDIKNGKVVRLTQGKFDKEKVYTENPLSIAKQFKEDGAALIHIIDLDGAQTGEPKNLSIIKEIQSTLNIPIEMGGGIRTSEAIEKILAAGISRVILGTRAVEDLEFLKIVLTKWNNKIAVSLDCVNGHIATKGWTKVSKIKATDFVPQIEALGLKTLIYTDIATDGMLQGPNISALSEILDATKMNVIASGGISSLNDIQSLCRIRTTNLIGVIVGKALYEKKFTLKEAITICSKNE